VNRPPEIRVLEDGSLAALVAVNFNRPWTHESGIAHNQFGAARGGAINVRPDGVLQPSTACAAGLFHMTLIASISSSNSAPRLASEMTFSE
jgi:hypothetical protein